MDHGVRTPGRVSLGVSCWFVSCLILGATASSCAKQPAPMRVQTVTVWPDTVTLSQGDTLRFRALSHAENDTPLEGRSVSWSTTDSSIVTVVAGVAIARGTGSASIVATSEGVVDSARVNVSDRALRAARSRP